MSKILSFPAKAHAPMRDSRTIHDPFLGKDVVIVDRLTDRLRGNYAWGPHLPNGRPEFGFRQFQAPPIQHEAAAYIDALEKSLRDIIAANRDFVEGMPPGWEGDPLTDAIDAAALLLPQEKADV